MTKERELLIEAERHLSRWIGGQASNEMARRIRDYLRTADENVENNPMRVSCPHCRKAPDGWLCTRLLGHDGPCAARPVPIPLGVG